MTLELAEGFQSSGRRYSKPRGATARPQDAPRALVRTETLQPANPAGGHAEGCSRPRRKQAGGPSESETRTVATCRSPAHATHDGPKGSSLNPTKRPSTQCNVI